MATKISTMEALATPYLMRVVEDDIKRIDEEIDTVWNQIKGTLEFKGFRKGHVPRSVAEHRLGIDKLYQKFLDQLFTEAAQQAEREIVGVREYNILQFKKSMPIIIEAVVDVKPLVELGEYKGIEVEEIDATVKDEQVENTLKRLQESSALIETAEENEAAVSGDIVVIDFEGKLKSGKLFPGNSDKNVELVLGSNSFIEGFEDQLIGAKIGEEREVEVTFPKEYSSEDVAGRKAVFSVKVKGLKHRILLDIDDEFAKDNGYEDLDDARKCLKEDIIQERESQIKTAYENTLIDQVVKISKVTEIPDTMIRIQLDNILAQRAEGHKSVEEYLAAIKLSREQFNVFFKNQAIQHIKVRLALEAVASAEEIEATEDDIQKYIEDEAQRQGVDASTLKSKVNIPVVKENIRIKKAINCLFENKKIIPRTEKESSTETVPSKVAIIKEENNE